VSEDPRARGGGAPSIWLMLALALVVVLAAIALWVYASLVCGLGENLSGQTARFCDEHGSDWVIGLPLIGAAIMLASVPAARLAQRAWVFWLGASAALAGATALWLLLGV
jgi:hypothetical protein